MSSADSLPYPVSNNTPDPTVGVPTGTGAVQPKAAASMHHHRATTPKTSISHPINISWMLPTEYLPLLAVCDLPDDIDLYDLADPEVEQQLAPQLWEAQKEAAAASGHPPKKSMGNLALSSCPGKKVRLTGPSRGRAAINRDLDLDFARMRSFNITTIVCCLDDTELEFLGAPWPKYIEAASRNGMQVIRLPMVEGSCPDTIEEIDAAIQLVDSRIRQGENVLTHCRGGVGRAGLFACCWLLRNLYCLSAERAIRYVRIRRSPKAIETMRQAEFIIHYSQYVCDLLDKQQLFKQSTTTAPDNDHHNHKPLSMSFTDHTLSVPSLADISSLERSMRENENC